MGGRHSLAGVGGQAMGISGGGQARSRKWRQSLPLVLDPSPFQDSLQLSWAAQICAVEISGADQSRLIEVTAVLPGVWHSSSSKLSLDTV